MAKAMKKAGGFLSTSTIKLVEKTMPGVVPGIKKGLGIDGKQQAASPNAVAPDPDAEAAANAESRRLQRRKRTGRTSTVMSEGSQLG